jgi:hypothetical protein
MSLVDAFQQRQDVDPGPKTGLSMLIGASVSVLKMSSSN